MNPAERTARLIRLLLEGPQPLRCLQAQLALSHDQLRRDLDALRRARWEVREQGRPKMLWIEQQEQGEHMQTQTVERTIQFAQTDTFQSGEFLNPKHCDALMDGCLQNGDIATIELIEKARRGWEDAQQRVFTILIDGYKVYKNDAPRLS